MSPQRSTVLFKTPPPGVNRFNIFPERMRFFFLKICILSAEMLKMLDYLGLRSPPSSPPPPKKHSTYSTFQQKEAHFDSTWGPRLQKKQVFLEKNPFPLKGHFFFKLVLCGLVFLHTPALPLHMFQNREG